METNKQKEMPLVSIITVCRNSEKTIRKTIDSVLNQIYENYEYVIIDGVSTDETLKIIKEFEPRFSGRMKWISEPDNGLYDAMNKGIKMAKGEWIHILNSDDFYVDADCWAKAIPRLKIEMTNYLTMLQRFSDGDKVYKFYPNKWKLYYSAYLPHPTLIVHKKQYEKIGLLNTQYKIAADHDLIMRLVSNYPMNYIDSPFVCMLIGGTSSQNIERSFKEFREISERNGLPKWLAELFYKVKIHKYNFLINGN